MGQVQGLPLVNSGRLEAHFPKLRETGYEITSPETREYNCIAWAADDTANWWWPPQPGGVSYWPTQVSAACTVGAFSEAFATLGYKECADGRAETGFEKIALYAKGDKPTHAARQLPDGRWTSKLGKLEDVEHTLEGLSECGYGQVVLFLKRRAGRHPNP